MAAIVIRDLDFLYLSLILSLGVWTLSLWSKMTARTSAIKSIFEVS